MTTTVTPLDRKLQAAGFVFLFAFVAAVAWALANPAPWSPLGQVHDAPVTTTVPTPDGYAPGDNGTRIVVPVDPGRGA